MPGYLKLKLDAAFLFFGVFCSAQPQLWDISFQASKTCVKFPQKIDVRCIQQCQKSNLDARILTLILIQAADLVP